MVHPVHVSSVSEQQRSGSSTHHSAIASAVSPFSSGLSARNGLISSRSSKSSSSAQLRPNRETGEGGAMVRPVHVSSVQNNEYGSGTHHSAIPSAVSSFSSGLSARNGSISSGSSKSSSSAQLRENRETREGGAMVQPVHVSSVQNDEYGSGTHHGAIPSAVSSFSSGSSARNGSISSGSSKLSSSAPLRQNKVAS